MTRYEVWCQAHIDATSSCGWYERPCPLKVCDTRKEADAEKRKADAECESGGKHFVKRVEDDQ